MNDTGVAEGQILAGKFRIERILGRGGMGVVVAATHLRLDERVAIKFLLPEALANAEAVKRFEREARAAVKIKSEHVARVTDVGVLESGSPYMVMEYLDGFDLGQYLEARGPLPIEETVEYVLQALEAIAEAHSLGIVHRDLKPANLFRILRADGSASIKVLDFGISKVTTGDNAMTRTSSMMGSPYYMSPEQMTNSKAVDARADVWALGIILHELLTGSVPYRGETIPEICAQVLQEPPPPLRSLRRDAPRELELLIEKALAKKRDDRFADVGALARALLPFAPLTAHRSVERVSRVLGVQTAPLGSPSPGNRTEPELEASTLGGAAHTQVDWRPPSAGPSPRVIASALAGVVVLAGLWAFFALSGSSNETEQANPSVTVEPLVPTLVEPTATTQSPLPEQTADPIPLAKPTPTSSASTKGAPPTSSVPSSSTPIASKPAVVTAPAPTTPAPSSQPPKPLGPAAKPASPATKPKADLYLDRK